MSDDRLDRIILLLGQVDGKISGLDGKIGGLSETLNDHTRDDKTNFGELSGRLIKIEKRSMWTSGVVAGAIAFLTAKLTGH